MAALTSTPRTRSSPQREEEWRGRPGLSERGRAPRRTIPGWGLVGLTVLGLGALAWYSFGPDLVRYLKIRNM